MKNKVQLITYVDRLGGGDVGALHGLLTGPLKDVFGGVHLLPFFDAIDGADAGFDPVDHTRVDPRLGQWDDVQRLAADVPVMADVIVNHMSSDSPEFRDFLALGDQSKFAGLFLEFDTVFPSGASASDLTTLYRPRPGLPFATFTVGGRRDGEGGGDGDGGGEGGAQRLLWTTFTAKQIDIDVSHPLGRSYLESILRTLAAAGVTMVRLDAVGYAVKRAGTDSFMTPETFAFIDEFTQSARGYGLEVLVEVHSHFQQQIAIAERVDCVYDFALPPLVLHAVYFKTATALARWITIRPNNAVTVLDTHDGIGIIDIGAQNAGGSIKPGLVPPAELDALVERIHSNSDGQSREATGAAASNLDLYQVNCTYFDALARDPSAYLLARAIQFFLPGIPQVYYVGLLAGCNDLALLRKTRVGRDINRHYFTPAEIDAALAEPLVQDLLTLIKLRNTHAAFDGTFAAVLLTDQVLQLTWQVEAETTQSAEPPRAATQLQLTADFATLNWHIKATDHGQSTTLDFISTRTA